MVYLLDTNIFITHKNSTPLDVYPSFWRTLSELAQAGIIRSVGKVKEELDKCSDELTEWVNNNLPKDFFIPEGAATFNALSTVSMWTNTSEIFTSAAKATFLSVADSWIVAEALAQGYVVVTFETSDPTCRRRVKIPDVCNALGVAYCTPNEMLRKLKISI